MIELLTHRIVVWVNEEIGSQGWAHRRCSVYMSYDYYTLNSQQRASASVPIQKQALYTLLGYAVLPIVATVVHTS